VFAGLGYKLTSGIDDWEVKGILKERLPDWDWSLVNLDMIMSHLIVADVVDVYDRPEPPSSSTFVPIRSFVKVYRLTKLGRHLMRTFYGDAPTQ